MPSIVEFTHYALKDKVQPVSKTMNAIKQSVDSGSAIEASDKWATEQINKIRPTKVEGGGIFSDAYNSYNEVRYGIRRGLLGFARASATGIAELGNMAAQHVTQQMMPPDPSKELDALILAENIRLGNVCLEGMANETVNNLNAIADSSSKWWNKTKEKWNNASLGDRTEMVTRMGAEIASILVPVTKVSKVAKAAELAKVVEATKVAEATKAAELAETAKVAEATKTAELAETAKVAEATKTAELAKDGVRVQGKKFNRRMSERRKALLRDAKDPSSGLTQEQRDFILEHNGYKVPEGLEVSHETPLYTGKTVEDKIKLDVADNMKVQDKTVHRDRHKTCGDQFHDFPR